LPYKPNYYQFLIFFLIYRPPVQPNSSRSRPSICARPTFGTSEWET